MNRTLIFIVLLITLALLIYYAFSSPVQNVPQVPQTTEQPVEQPAGEQQPASQSTSSATSTINEVGVSIKDFSFSPSVATVKVGSRVVWINNDSVAHDIDGGDVFRSSTLQSGDTFSFVFTKAGTYTYICSVHPSMKGQVVVQ